MEVLYNLLGVRVYMFACVCVFKADTLEKLKRFSDVL